MAPWGDEATLGSGLPDRFQLTIASAKVGFPYEKNPMQAAVVIEGEQKIDDDIEDTHLWLKPGKQFTPGDDDGTFLLHNEQTPDVFDTPGAKIKKINKNSAYGKFLASAMAVDQSALEANQSADRAKYQIWDLSFWTGLVLDVEVVDEPFEFKNDAGEEVKGSSRQPYVRAILGKSDAVAGATATTTEAPSAAAPASANGAVDPKAFDTHIAYLDAFVAAGGDPADPKAAKSYYEAARA